MPRLRKDGQPDLRCKPRPWKGKMTANTPYPTAKNPIVRELFTVVFARGLSTSYLADKLGYDRSDISRWKSGKKLPKLQPMMELADFLGYELVLRRKK